MDIKQIFNSAGIKKELTEKERELFTRYYQILIEENQKYNLTAITDEKEVYIKHFADSLTALDYIKEGATLLDIGSGGGFPAVPIIIMRPDIIATMIDSVNKKVLFLNYLLEKLSLRGRAIHIRAEDFKTAREKFDIVISRAVAKLPTLLEYTLPYAKIGGSVLAYKTESEEAETVYNAIKKLGGGEIKIHDKSYLDFKRLIFQINKVIPTPLQYPRSGNKPRLQPL